MVIQSPARHPHPLPRLNIGTAERPPGRGGARVDGKRFAEASLAKRCRQLVEEVSGGDKQRIETILDRAIVDGHNASCRVPRLPCRMKQRPSVTKSGASAEPSSEVLPVLSDLDGRMKDVRSRPPTQRRRGRPRPTGRVMPLLELYDDRSVVPFESSAQRRKSSLLELIGSWSPATLRDRRARPQSRSATSRAASSARGHFTLRRSISEVAEEGLAQSFRLETRAFFCRVTPNAYA